MLQLQHLLIPAYAMVNLMKSRSVKSFGIVNDHTDTYFILNVQSCRLCLEPFLDTMAPEAVCLVMHTLHKSTLNEAFTSRQIVDAVVSYAHDLAEACKILLLLLFFFSSLRLAAQ